MDAILDLEKDDFFFLINTKNEPLRIRQTYKPHKTAAHLTGDSLDN